MGDYTDRYDTTVDFAALPLCQCRYTQSNAILKLLAWLGLLYGAVNGKSMCCSTHKGHIKCIQAIQNNNSQDKSNGRHHADLHIETEIYVHFNSSFRHLICFDLFV